MNRCSRFLPATLAAVVWLSAGANLTYAQSRWIPRDGKGSVTMEFLRPSIESVNAGTFSGSFFLTGRLETSSHLAVVGEIPYARHSSTQTFFDYFSGTETVIKQSGGTIGNPYFGIEAAPSSGPTFVELGVRLPLVSKDQELAQATGLFADITRWEAFYYRVVSVQTAFNVREVTPSNVEYRLRLSPVLSIPTEGSADPEIFGLYSLQIGYHGRALRLGTGVSGRMLLTEDSGNLGQRSLNQLELHADFGSWGVRPGFDLHLPLDSWAESVPVVLGATVSWSR